LPVIDYLKHKQIKARVRVIAASLDNASPTVLAHYLNSKNRYAKKSSKSGIAG
jgi:hypothetical protein